MADHDIRRADRKRTFSLRTARTSLLQLAPLRTRLAEIEDAHFHYDSAVLMPDWSGDPELVGAGGTTTGLAVLATCLEHARAQPKDPILVAGHTDTSGDEAYNLRLSRTRAANVRAALVGAKKEWVDTAESKHVVQDWQRILKWVAWLWGWPCDPGQVDGDHGTKTRAAVKVFQHLAGEELQEKISVDGDVGRQTWGAIFEVYQRVLCDVLEIDRDALDALHGELKFTEAKTVGCGENFPTADRDVPNLRSATNRRVEILFFAPDEVPTLACHPAPEKCTKELCDLYAPGTYRTTYLPASLKLNPTTISLTITDVAGLYKPGHVDPADAAAGTGKLAGYERGYKSDDDLGRIFINTKPRTDPNVTWDSVFAKDVQYIEIEVAVAATGGLGRVPAGTRVQWAWEDPDDPSNAAMEKFSSALVDPNDSGLDPTKDNLGQHDHPKKAAGKGAKFAAVGKYGLEDVDEHTVTTAIVDGVSRVRMHGTNVGGDNFRVHASLRAHQLVVPGAEDSTGLMTMWKRVDVEYRVMEGADDLPVDDLPPFFEPCFVQMDVAPVQSTPKIEHMAAKKGDVSKVAARYVKKPPTGVFVNEGKPGWFLLVSAHRASRDLATVTATSAFKGRARIDEVTWDTGDRGDCIVIDAAVPGDIGKVVLEEGGKKAFIPVWSKAENTPRRGQTTLYINALDYQSDFVPGDGSLAGAYHRSDLVYPRHTWFEHTRQWTAGGMGFGEHVDVEVFTKGGFETAGVSPENTIGGKTYFAGRTVVFSKHPSFHKNGFDPAKFLSVMVHELGHAFGFPHKCGYHTWEDVDTSCAMNYPITWLYEAGTRTIRRFFPGTEGNHMCARHLHGIRRVHLEDNPAMWKW